MSGNTLSIILLLTLGIGSTTAVFNPILSLVCTPLPLPQPDRLVKIGRNIPLFNLLNSTFKKRELLDRFFSNLSTYSASFETSLGTAIINIPNTLGTGLPTTTRNITVGFNRRFGRMGHCGICGYMDTNPILNIKGRGNLYGRRNNG